MAVLILAAGEGGDGRSFGEPVCEQRVRRGGVALLSKLQDMQTQWCASPQTWMNGETATLTPSGGSPTTVSVVVERGELELHGPAGVQRLQYRIRSVKIRKADHTTLTIDGDTIALPRRLGGSNVTYTIKELLDQEGGFWTVGVG